MEDTTFTQSSYISVGPNGTIYGHFADVQSIVGMKPALLRYYNPDTNTVGNYTPPMDTFTIYAMNVGFSYGVCSGNNIHFEIDYEVN